MTRIWYTVTYIVWLLLEVLKQSARLAWDVTTPGLQVSPSIVEFPLHAETPMEIAAIEASITITPGTLTLGIYAPEDGSAKSLFVHFLYAHTHEDAIAELEDMERRLLRATRGPGKEGTV
ncbi:MAG: Na+/H+ antiporter subunit E [Actinomycetia bacterium]|nr:Na+/H+ antiporter subunit E [Actinomycetes bacterium]